MKKKAFTIAFYTSYILSIVLAIAFIVFVVLSWFGRKELLQNPLVLIAPFSVTVKHWARCFLIPSFIFAVLGYILQQLKKRL